MRKPEQLRLTIVLIVLALFTVVCASGGGEESAADPITAKIIDLSGKVQVQKASVGEFKPAAKDDLLIVNDQVLTREDGRARIDLHYSRVCVRTADDFGIQHAGQAHIVGENRSATDLVDTIQTRPVLADDGEVLLTLCHWLPPRPSLVRAIPLLLPGLRF